MELMLTSRKRCDFPFNLTTEPLDMPLTVLGKAMELAEENKGEVLLLNGNEPVLYPDLDKVFAMAAKRGISLAVETSGLMPDSAKQILIQARPFVAWRIFRPEFYGEADLRESKANLKELLDARVNVQFVLIVDDPGKNYEFVVDWIKEFKVPVLVFRSDCSIPVDERRDVIANITKIAMNIMLSGGNFVYDCCQEPCAFCNEDYGMMSKIGIKRANCTPHLLVLPDGTMAHCRAMTIVPGPNVAAFKSYKELLDYYYDVFRHMQLSVSEKSDCVECVTRRVKLCTGPNMAAKAKALIKDREYLRPLLAKQDSGHEEHISNTWQMAAASIKLGLNEDAVECLEEMRRLTPENPDVHFWLGCTYWDIGRRDEAEDEFRKCSRLSEDHVPPLVELHRRFQKNGNGIRARMLLEEIKRMTSNKDK